MPEKILSVLSLILVIITTILCIRIGKNIKDKKAISEANSVFNEHNEIYITRDELIGKIEYK